MQVEILADSINNTGNRLTTFLLQDFPKQILAQLSRHRVLSLNAASSRAIPIAAMIQNVIDDPFIPQWTGHQKGMSGNEDMLTDEQKDAATCRCLDARDRMIDHATHLISIGVHKQEANRYLEPWAKVPVIVSGTEWENFFNLRCHPSAQPDFRAFAVEMQRLRNENQPKLLKFWEWHFPYFDPALTDDQNLVVSSAKCAAVSYRTHDKEKTFEEYKSLHDKLMQSGHWSPFEHSAFSLDEDAAAANFRGWWQYRAQVELQRSLIA